MFASRMKRHRRSVESVSRTLLYLRWLVGLLVVALVPAAVGVAATRAPARASQTGPALHTAAAAGPAAVPGEIVVGFRSGVDASDRAAARSVADVSAERNLLVPGAQLVRVERGQSVQEAVTELEQRPDVRYAEPNWIYHADATPDDPRLGNLWGLHNTAQAVNGHAAGTADADIDAPEAWDGNTGSSSTVVAVVDSGVAWDHPDLAPNIWSNVDEVAGNGVDDDRNGKVDDVRGWDFVDRDNNPWDYDDHGTHVAGTIAARGQQRGGHRRRGVAGVDHAAPRAGRLRLGHQRRRRGRVHVRGGERARGWSTLRSAARATRRRSPTRSAPIRTRCSSSPPATTGRTTTRRRRTRAITRGPTSSASRRPTAPTRWRASPTTARRR